MIRIKQILNRLTLAQRFMLASLVILIAGTLGLGAWVGEQIKTGVINSSGATTALYVDSFVAPLLQELGHSQQISPQNIQTLNTLLRDTSLGRQVFAFKVWDLNGQVVYSTDPGTIGLTFPLHDALLQASQGEVSARISVEEEENAPQRALHAENLEIYSPVRLTGTNQVIAVAEYYQTTDDLQDEIAAAQLRSWLVVAGVMGLIYLLLYGFVRQASSTIENQKVALNHQVTQLTELLDENQHLHDRVRRAAASIATINERLLRRVGSELHDGPVQDLGLALLQIDAISGQAEKGAAETGASKWVLQLEKIQGLLQNTLKEMRAIASGLSLPQLNELNLTETVIRVVRSHERRTGTKVTLAMEAVPDNASLPIKITAYRFIQEALNNAFRHAGGAGQEVRVAGEAKRLTITVCDHGPGLPGGGEPAAVDGHFGLAGMRERVESLAGTFDIESQAGAGTRVTAHLPLDREGELR